MSLRPGARLRLRRLLSADRGERVAAAVEGVLAWAQSRLTRLDYAALVTRADLAGVPLTAVAARSHASPERLLDTLIGWAVGAVAVVSDATLSELSPSFGDASTAASAHVDGDTYAAGVMAGALDVAGGSAVAQSVAVAGNANFPEVSAAALRIDGAPAATCALTALVVSSGSLRLTRRLRPVDAAGQPGFAAAFGAGAGTALHEAANGVLEVTKRQPPAAATDRRVSVGAPDVDAGWIDVIGHTVGDPATNPPYEMTYPTGIALSAVSPGDPLGIVDAEIWVRAPLHDDAAPHATPPGTLGLPVISGSRWFAPSCGLVDGWGGGLSGADVVLDSAGALTLRTGVIGQHDRRDPRISALLLLWRRGQP